ncbi:hypothetical protein [Streptomyces sp. NPDC003023]|uniref:hypothetical protein n=1 Tax=Streptomyces sp. NPDC003023 TaxID=3364675 RepID=UPI003688ABFB
MIASLRVPMLHLFDDSAPAKLAYQFDLAGLSPAKALKVLRLCRRLSVGADDGPAVGESLRSGRVSEAIVVLRPARGEYYRMFLTDSPDDGMLLSLCPLGLDGYPDPRQS